MIKSRCPFCKWCCLREHCDYTLEACAENAEISKKFKESNEDNFMSFLKTYLEELRNGTKN
jgi:adenine-specific DNA glycosylase